MIAALQSGGSMANKIPVAATVARAYGFAFGNFLGNLGAIWLPLAILYGLLYLTFGPYMQAMTALTSRDPAAIGPLLSYIFLGYLVLFVIMAAQITGLTREALGRRRGSAWLQLPFGAATWRLLLAWLALMLVAIILYFAVLFLAVVAGFLAGFAVTKIGGTHSAWGPIAVAAIVFGVFFTFLYWMTRLSFLVAPVVVAEGPRALQRSWELTRGNFWRIVAVSLAVVIPLVAVECALLYGLTGSDFFSLARGADTARSVEHMRMLELAAIRRSAELTKTYWYIACPAGVIASVVLYGLIAGVSAFSYRALMPQDGSPANAPAQQTHPGDDPPTAVGPEVAELLPGSDQAAPAAEHGIDQSLTVPERMARYDSLSSCS
jgi:hypothetical protein